MWWECYDRSCKEGWTITREHRDPIANLALIVAIDVVLIRQQDTPCLPSSRNSLVPKQTRVLPILAYGWIVHRSASPHRIYSSLPLTNVASVKWVIPSPIRFDLGKWKTIVTTSTFLMVPVKQKLSIWPTFELWCTCVICSILEL